MKKIIVDQAMQELTQHGTPGFPLVIYKDDFADFSEGLIGWHWHKEIQFSAVTGGEIEFALEGESKVLRPGEAIFINKNVMHQIKPVKLRTGTMFSLDFADPFIGGEATSLIAENYVTAVTENQAIKSVCLSGAVDWQRGVIRSLLEINEVYQAKEYGYELRLKGLLCLTWLTLARETQARGLGGIAEKPLDELRVKTAVQYIQENYPGKITLEEIAAAINISKSECCRCFQRVIKMSPIEFVLQTRLIEAAKQIGSAGQSVSEVAYRVGFNDLSYFGKAFKQRFGCSPSMYRRVAG